MKQPFLHLTDTITLKVTKALSSESLDFSFEL